MGQIESVRPDIMPPPVRRPEVHFLFKHDKNELTDQDREHISQYHEAFNTLWDAGVIAPIRRIASQTDLNNPHFEMHLPSDIDPAYSFLLRWDPVPLTYPNSEKIIVDSSIQKHPTYIWKSYGIKASYKDGKKEVEFMEAERENPGGEPIKGGGGWKKLERSIIENHTYEEQVGLAKREAQRRYFDRRRGLNKRTLSGSSEMKKTPGVIVEFKGGSQVFIREL
jgi:hypothetical protein